MGAPGRTAQRSAPAPSRACHPCCPVLCRRTGARGYSSEGCRSGGRRTSRRGYRLEATPTMRDERACIYARYASHRSPLIEGSLSMASTHQGRQTDLPSSRTDLAAFAPMSSFGLPSRTPSSNADPSPPSHCRPREQTVARTRRTASQSPTSLGSSAFALNEGGWSPSVKPALRNRPQRTSNCSVACEPRFPHTS